MTISTKSKPAKPAPPPKPPKPDDSLRVESDGLVYSLDAAPKKDGKRSVVTVRSTADGGRHPLVDRLDLFAFKSRKAFAGLVSDVFGRDSGATLGHLALLLDEVERATTRNAPTEVVLTDERKKAALEVLGQDDLLDRLAAALDGLGLVGEDGPRRIALLVAVSRMLSRPLSVLFLAPPGTGKSSVIDAVVALTPPEDVVGAERLTPASLYYAGPSALAHKLLVVDELDGAAEAMHALRVLQSKGEVRLSTTVGGKAESFTARGPVAVMSGTTSPTVDPQNASRCWLVELDPSREQTERVHGAQRRAWAKPGREVLDLEPWRDVQRVLERVPVAIPFAERLRFPTRITTDRRASARVLGLVAAHALLHQLRRKRDAEGRVIAEVRDYELVHRLVRPLVENDGEELSPRATALARSLPDGPFTRDQIASVMNWSYSTSRRAIDELVGREVLRPVAGEYPRRWRVEPSVAAGLGAAVVLTDPKDLRRA